MNRNRFDALINDTSVIKLQTAGGFFLKDFSNKKVIGFFFSHTGDMNYTDILPEKRVFISVYPIDEFEKDIPTKEINSNVTVLANADQFDYALVYELSVKHQVFTVSLIDKPNVGDKFITEEETSGMSINLNSEA